MTCGGRLGLCTCEVLRERPSGVSSICGVMGVALERRLVLHSFLHTRLVCVGLARLARLARPCRTS